MPSKDKALTEWTHQFEQRKRDHIRISLDAKTQAIGASGLNKIELTHEAFPELNLEDISINLQLFGKTLRSPLFVSSMTAGHDEAVSLNALLAEVCAERGWAMGVGSQRRQLSDPQAHREWEKIRRLAPDLVLMGNIGLSQLIETPSRKIQEMVDVMQAQAMIVHTNPLQECFQPEGSPSFRGGFEAVRRLASELSVPVVIKETGCGFSEATLKRLTGLGIYAVDLSGKGGTHWGRVEGQRSEPGEKLYQAADSFRDWGISTVECMLNAQKAKGDFRIWASGGVRSGLDAAKLIAMGAEMVGYAKPVMEAALKGRQQLVSAMELWEFELKVAMFCTGCAGLTQLREKRVWQTV